MITVNLTPAGPDDWHEGMVRCNGHDWFKVGVTYASGHEAEAESAIRSLIAERVSISRSAV